MQSGSDLRQLRVLMIGAQCTAGSLRAGNLLSGDLPPEFELEFSSTEEVLEDAGCVSAGSFDAVLLDARSMPAPTRSERVKGVLKSVLGHEPRAKVITLVRSSDRMTAGVAVSFGSWDVARTTDRCSLADRLRAAAACRQIESEPGSRPLDASRPREMVGTSPAIRGVFAHIRQVAVTDVPVLISGESGTGKELAALAIHERSQRASGPFVPINCAAIPEALLESELFGYERGAFTGATRSSPGLVETADGGTLFLDEVGELAPGLQAKVLRFLEDHVVEHLGGRNRFPVDVRVIAATNRDLSSSVDRGEFRGDLYYRLAVFPIHMPPLRERSEDVLVMGRLYLQRYAREAGRDLRGFSGDAVDALRKWSWPGNVRELINRIRRAVVVADGALVTAVDLGFEVAPVEAPLLTLREAQVQVEIDCVRRALERFGGNRCQAARALGISRSTLYELLRRHQLE